MKYIQQPPRASIESIGSTGKWGIWAHRKPMNVNRDMDTCPGLISQFYDTKSDAIKVAQWWGYEVSTWDDRDRKLINIASLGWLISLLAAVIILLTMALIIYGG